MMHMKSSKDTRIWVFEFCGPPPPSSESFDDMQRFSSIILASLFNNFLLNYADVFCFLHVGVALYNTHSGAKRAGARPA